jgi:hypothetical protein
VQIKFFLPQIPNFPEPGLNEMISASGKRGTCGNMVFSIYGCIKGINYSLTKKSSYRYEEIVKH